MADKVVPSLPGGYYVSDRTVNWTFDPSVVEVAYTINGIPPSISEYIAYDTLTPPNPFIAVTQDGKGNVVYDGGFPKFMNSVAPAAGATFAQLTGTWKFLHNMLKFIANPTKVAAGNNKILVLGDKSAAGDVAYAVKGTIASGFATSIPRICQIAGFVATLKDIDDYGGVLNPNLAELDQYCAVILLSTNYVLTNPSPLISNNAVTDMVSFRQAGNGIALITDHGKMVMTDISQVTTADGEGFYATANRVARNFGAFFTGNFDRTPVNVGFLRSTYGDHPLYNGLLDTDDVWAGGSESKVVVTTATMLTPGQVPATTFTAAVGSNKINWLVKTSDGSIYTYTFVYNIDTGEIILFKDENGNEMSQIDIGWDFRAKPKVDLSGTGLGTLRGSIYHGATKVGETYFDEVGGTRMLWYGGAEGVPVKNGDTIRATVDVPFTYSRTVNVVRKAANIKPLFGLGKVAQAIHALVPTELRQAAVAKAFANIQPFYQQVYQPGGARNIDFLRNYFDATLPLTDVSVNAYTNATELNNALATITPPSTRQIFDTWARFSGDSYYAPGITGDTDAMAWYWDDAQQSAVQPNNTTPYVGFISNYATENYDLEVTLQSTNGDDDFISVVLAFYRDTTNNLNNTLNLTMSAGAAGWSGRPGKWPAVTLNTDTNMVAQWATQTDRYKEFALYQGEDVAGWAGRYRKAKISRKGDQFVVQLSDWNSPTYNPALTMSVNLNADPLLTKFKGPSQYGFATMSQPAATFKNLTLQDGYRWDVILDIANNRVYRYLNGAWALVEGVTIHQVFGAPRVIKTITGNKSYRLNTDGSISTL